MENSPILSGKPFSEEKTTQIAEQFFRDGFVHIPGVLTEDEVTALRDKTDAFFADPELAVCPDYCLSQTQNRFTKQHIPIDLIKFNRIS